MSYSILPTNEAFSISMPERVGQGERLSRTPTRQFQHHSCRSPIDAFTAGAAQSAVTMPARM